MQAYASPSVLWRRIALLGNMTTPVYAAGGQVGTVQGTVVDSVTHKPISGASVSLAGLSGPQTGVNSCVNQVGTARGCYPTVPKESYAFTNGAYLLSNGNFTSTPSFGPIQPFTVQAFYQRTI